ncbi:MAG: CDP-glycerol glycerophosphotransferase family protein [Clostridia bacterium]|nr:CDP-glycerol glycerophosphotransferase family protein [Clostridia bacterium]
MKSFFKKFKNVKLRDIGHIFLFLLALPIALVYKTKRKDLWLFCDNGKEASDNGFVLFEYVCKNYPKQDAVYAVYENSIDFSKVKATGKYVKYGSFLHWILYLTARVNISSQKSGKPNYAVCNLLEVYGILKNNRVFLQHGIILTDIEFLYYKNTKMSLFTTSTYREWECVNNNYGYPEGVVKLLGLPRFDKLHGFKVNKGQILIMPTWREWIGTDSLSKNISKDIKAFKQTEYFKKWNALLNSPKLAETCEKFGVKIMFYPHRDAQRFVDCFDTKNPNLTICKYPEYTVGKLLKTSEFMITDFSSVQADFAYMKKPLAYYHFDYEDYSEKQYHKAYFEYEKDGFGPTFQDADALADYVYKMAENGFQNYEPYISRHKDFFTLYDNNNCERNYQAIKDKWS